MMKFTDARTGRPLFVNPHSVVAVLDCVDVVQPKLAGGKPTVTIRGTTLVLSGGAVNVSGDASDIFTLLDSAGAFGRVQ